MTFDRLPKQLIFELTAKCNYRCPFCYCLWHEFPSLGAPELDTSGWKAVLDRCAESGVEDILFSGGEALLRPDLFTPAETQKILGHERGIGEKS